MTSQPEADAPLAQKNDLTSLAQAEPKAHPPPAEVTGYIFLLTLTFYKVLGEQGRPSLEFSESTPHMLLCPQLSNFLSALDGTSRTIRTSSLAQ